MQREVSTGKLVALAEIMRGAWHLVPRKRMQR